MKIVLAVHGFLPHRVGGTELHTLAMGKELQEQGHQVVVIYRDYRGEQEEGSITRGEYEGLSYRALHYRPTENLLYTVHDPRVAKSFLQCLEAERPDLVHFQHLVGLTLSSLSACKQNRIPSVVTVRDAWLICDRFHLIRTDQRACHRSNPTTKDCVSCFMGGKGCRTAQSHGEQLRDYYSFRNYLMRTALMEAEAVIFPSQFLKDLLTDRQIRLPSFYCIPHGLQPFRPLPWRPSSDKVRFLYLGNIYPTKGLDVLINAFLGLKSERARLKIYGNIVDRSYFQDVLSHVPGDAACIYAGGYDRRTLPKILAETDVAVIPSRFESYCHVLRECFHAKVPVIASDVGGISEGMTHGEGGLLFPPGEENKLQEHMKYFLKRPERILDLKRTIPAVPTMDSYIRSLEKVYASIVAAQHQALQSTG